jgi:biopolymer transport protein ExbD
VSNPFVKHDEAAPIADVNVVPLADVSLVLLIILLVLSPMAAQSMLKVQTAAAKKEVLDEAKGPKAGEDPLNPKPLEPVFAVGLSPQGYIFDGRLITTDAELKTWVQPKLSARDDKKVFLAPELDVMNGRVVGAIEALQAAGASSVALVQVYDPSLLNPPATSTLSPGPVTEMKEFAPEVKH